MYFKLFYTFSLIFVAVVNGELDARNSSLLRQNTNRCDLTAHPQCSSDCSTILLCYAGIENPIFSIKCPSTTPYCDNGRCTDTPGSCSLKSDTSSFVCTSSGLFPDPSDCTKYHSCAEGVTTSIPDECRTGYIFNSKFKMCVRKGLRADHQDRKICQKISCDGVANDFILFEANPAFYAYCFMSPAGESQIYMYKCDDDISKVFDLKTKKCKFNCKSVGYFADPLDCSAYYICNRRGSNFSPRHIHCPPNYYFNGTACLNSAAHCPAGSMTITPTVMTTSTTLPSQMTDGTTTVVVATDVTEMTTEYTSEMNTEIVSESTEKVSESTEKVSESTEKVSESTEKVSESTEMPTGTTTDADTGTTQINMNDPISLQADVVTSVPFKSPIWKHMGRFSVRIGRYLNLI